MFSQLRCGRESERLQQWQWASRWLGGLNHINIQRLIGVDVQPAPSLDVDGKGAVLSSGAGMAGDGKVGGSAEDGAEGGAEGSMVLARSFTEWIPMEHPRDGRTHDFTSILNGSLYNTIRQRGGAPLDVDDSRTMFRQLLAGVSYIHRYGVVHCNITAANVYINERGTVKLAGFDFARSSSSCVTTSGDNSGSESKDYDSNGADDSNNRNAAIAPAAAAAATTAASSSSSSSSSMEAAEETRARRHLLSQRVSVRYSAPEVLDGMKFSFASDMWSVGCVLLEMVSGHVPWTNPKYTAAGTAVLAHGSISPALSLDATKSVESPDATPGTQGVAAYFSYTEEENAEDTEELRVLRDYILSSAMPPPGIADVASDSFRALLLELFERKCADRPTAKTLIVRPALFAHDADSQDDNTTL